MFARIRFLFLVVPWLGVLAGCSGVPDTDDVKEALINNAKANNKNMDKFEKSIDEAKLSASCQPAEDVPLFGALLAQNNNLKDAFYCVVTSETEGRSREMFIVKKNGDWVLEKM